jgi:RNA polymerase sigma-70 factor (ECF subfamily)
VQDLELLEQWRAGDQKAGEGLLKAYFPILYRFFANKVSSDVDDLVQQTLIALSGNRDKFEARSSFRAYLLSIARFQLYNYVRHRARANAKFEFDTVTAFDLSPSPSTLAVAHAQQQLLLEALRRIPLNFQIALELHYWEDLTGPELAEALGVPLDTAYSRVKKARELVKKQLQVLARASDRETAWEDELRNVPKG